jgi:hypothetical protein
VELTYVDASMIRQPDWAGNDPQPPNRAAEQAVLRRLEPSPGFVPEAQQRIFFGNPFTSAFLMGLGFFSAALIVSIVGWAIVIIVMAVAGGSGVHAVGSNG